MGTLEKCPKCGARLWFEKGGYAHANVASGYGHQLTDALTCKNCGKYIELESDPVMKDQFSPNPKKQIRKSRNVVFKDSGSLQRYIIDKFEYITELKVGRRWADVVEILSEETGCSLCENSIIKGYLRFKRGEVQ